ncbi:MAG: ComEC/Rec2 family competence protein [Ruminococcus sp.]|nr:ComEC/Rec2 family competence protein [Ruminococcus sp.]
MKRKVILAAAAYVSGLFFASFFYDINGVIIALSAAVLVAALAKLKGFKAVDYLIISVFFIMAVTVNRSYTHFVYDKIAAYSGTDGSFCGEITDYTMYDGNFASYTIKGKINNEQKARISLFTTALDADYGDIVTIEKCTFSTVEGDYLFDSAEWNKSRHIFLEAEKISGISVEKRNMSHIRRSLSRFRNKMSERILIEMTDETGSVLAGMIFGEKRHINDQTRTALYKAGIGHILAVSGLHVSTLGAIVMAVLKRLRLNKYLCFAAVNIVLILFTALAEYPVSAIRAVFMLDMLYSAELFGEQNDSLNSICLAALIICICDCYVLYSSSFILSFCGTYGAAVFAPYMTENIRRETIRGKVMYTIASAVFVSLAVTPASMYYFDETSIISPLSNILLLPLCTASMLCGMAFVVTGGIFSFLLIPARLFLTAVIGISHALSSVPFLTIPRIDELIPAIFIISAGAVAVTYLFSGNKKTVSNILLIVVLLSASVNIILSQSSVNRTSIAVLGDKTSAAVVISCGRERLIVDMGGSNEEYVEKYLVTHGGNYNDHLLLTERIEAKYVSYGQNFDNLRIYSVNGGNDEFDFSTNKFKAEYSDGILEITVENCVIAFHPAKAEDDISADLCVVYGNVPKSADMERDCLIIRDNGNNFEILPLNGKYRIRSL